jgi:3-oxoacyl-[acyl-carrier protein] reductase
MAGLDGRTAPVTGGGRGIGRAICMRLAHDGADIAINYARDETSANEALGAVRALGRRAEVYQADVADEAAVDAMCAQAIADFGQIDICQRRSKSTPLAGVKMHHLL